MAEAMLCRPISSAAISRASNATTCATASGGLSAASASAAPSASTKSAARRSASEIFLEVRENNQAALSLYRQAGFLEVGRRPNYYAGVTGARFAALTMRRRLDNFDL